MASSSSPESQTKKEEPISSRLRPRFKTERKGGINVNNQTDKPRVSKILKNQSSSIVAKKIEVPTISKDKSTKKSTDSKPKSIEAHAAASSSIASLSLKDQSAETKRKLELKNQNAKGEASQTLQSGNKTSSSSRKRQNEEPVASTSRPPFKTGRVGGIRVDNQTDKPSQVSKYMGNQSSSPVVKKSTVLTIGKPSKDKSTMKSNHSKPTVGQPSKDKSTMKNSDSKPQPQSIEVHAASSHRTCLCSKDHGAETKGKLELKNQHAKRESSKPPQWGTNASSDSRKKQNPIITKNQSFVTRKSRAYEPFSSNFGKGKEKIRPSQKQAQKPRNDNPIYYITCQGSEEFSDSEETDTIWNCALCEGDMAYPSYDEEEDELLDSLLLHEREELGPAVPEAAVLSCGHVFHSTCLTLELTELNDPPCPLCISW